VREAYKLALIMSLEMLESSKVAQDPESAIQQDKPHGQRDWIVKQVQSLWVQFAIQKWISAVAVAAVVDHVLSDLALVHICVP
jgi:hypothetical protein